MDATEGMKKAIAERKRLLYEKLKAMRKSGASPEPYRQRHMGEQRRQE